MKIPARGNRAHEFGTLLFDLDQDPQQKNPLTDAELEKHWIQQLLAAMHANDVPAEQFERLGLPIDDSVEDHHLLLEAQYEQATKAMAPDFMAFRLPKMVNNPQLLHIAIEKLYQASEARAILDTYLPGLQALPHYAMFKQFPLGTIGVFAPQLLPAETLQKIARALDELAPEHGS